MNKGRFFVVLLSLICTNSSFAYESVPLGETKKIDIDIEADEAAIESVWSSFQSALLANDISLAGQHYAPNSRKRHVDLLKQMGSFMATMPDRWSEFTPIRIGSDLAVYGFSQEERNGARLHTVTFVRHPELGWLIQSM